MGGENVTSLLVSAGWLVGLANCSVTVSPIDKPRVTGGGLAATAVNSPGQHDFEPDTLSSGALQGRHTDSFAAPTTALAVPARHRVQSDTNREPDDALKEPAGHAWRWATQWDARNTSS